MRFIKKASLKNMSEVSESYKEIELYTTREDFSSNEKIEENISVIKKNYDENKAVITSIHCPSSKWLTSMDKEVSTNYMSLCEVIAADEEKVLFLKICDFAKSVSNIYNKFNSKVSSNQLAKQQDDLVDNEDEDSNDAIQVKITLILHTGCLLGCFSNDKQEESPFDCPFKQTDRNKCFQEESIIYNKVEEIVVKIIGYETLQIAFKNITPFHENGNVGSNGGYGYENFILAKLLNKLAKEIIEAKEKSQEEVKQGKNKKIEPKIFGTVIDFCHILATKHLLNIQSTDIEYLEGYLKNINEEYKALIMLFHLSKYNKDCGTHGDVFCESYEDNKILDLIRVWCVKNARSTPITLEVSGGESVETGRENFNRIMMDWSKLHILLEKHLSDELYTFFSDLFTVYSLIYTKKNKKKIFEAAQNIRRYILKKSKLNKKLFGFNNENQELNIYLFQVQAYTYYMRYCNLAFDLISKYENIDVDIDTVLSHYIFNDELEEIKFDGLGCYYNIYWFKNNTTLYRCFDGCSGNNKYNESHLKNIISSCFSHINGGFDGTNFLSFSKSFGRVMLKYFDPYKYQTYNGKEYNVEVFKNAPVNYFLISKDKQITLQGYQDNPVDYSNFSIDFSDFYNGRGDRSKDASLKELYEKVSKDTKWNDSKIGSIYDQEVILCNYNNLSVQKYYLSNIDFVIMMIAYKLILKKYKDIKDATSIVDSVVNKRDSIFDSINLLQIDNEASKIVNETTIKEILKSVDFVYEQANPIDTSKDGFTGFTEKFVQVYKNVEIMDFYKEIIQEIEKNEKC